MPTNAFLGAKSLFVSMRMIGIPASAAFWSEGSTWSAPVTAMTIAATFLATAASTSAIWAVTFVSASGPSNVIVQPGNSAFASSTPEPTVFQ